MSLLVILRASMGVRVPSSINAQKRLGGGNGRRAAERQVAGFRDNVFRGVGRVTFDPEGEAERVAAGDRAVLAEAVGVFDFAEVRSRLAVDGVHEELFCFFAIFPRHCGPRLLSWSLAVQPTPILPRCQCARRWGEGGQHRVP